MRQLLAFKQRFFFFFKLSGSPPWFKYREISRCLNYPKLVVRSSRTKCRVVLNFRGISLSREIPSGAWRKSVTVRDEVSQLWWKACTHWLSVEGEQLFGVRKGYLNYPHDPTTPTTHNPQPTTHNPQPTTHDPQLIAIYTQSICVGRGGNSDFPWDIWITPTTPRSPQPTTHNL